MAVQEAMDPDGCTKQTSESTMRRIAVTNARDVGKILDYVHDRSVELSKIRFDEKVQVLSLPVTVVSEEIRDLKRRLLFVKTWKNPVVEATLSIKYVLEYRVEDRAHIDAAIINTIRAEEGSVRITCSVPVEIEVRVSRLEMELVISDRSVAEKRRFALAFD